MARSPALARVGLDHLARRLHQLDQHALAAERELAAALGMDEADVVTRGALADPARREAHALALEPRDRRGEVVHPEPDVVQRGVVHLRLAVRVDRLHQVDLDPVRARAGHRDVLVHVLALAAELALERESQEIDPEPAQRELVGPAHGDLLQPEHPERSRRHHRCLPSLQVAWWAKASSPLALHRTSPCGLCPPYSRKPVPIQ